MFKNLFLNTTAIRYDAEGDHKTPVQLAREAIAKNATTVKTEPEVVVKTVPEEDEDKDEDEEAEDEENEDSDEDNEEDEETEEEKTARLAKEAKETAKEAAEAKEKRTKDRIQKRIDKAVAAQKQAEDRVAVLEAQLKADPDKTLTEEEINKRAKVLADDSIAAKELEKLQKEFNKACDKLQDAANKLDKEFTPKVVAMAEELGPIPSRVIGILDDLENGAKVLKFMVDDIDEAEKIYDLKDKPEKLAIALVRISDRLAEADKPKPKVISKVPNPIENPRGSRVQTNNITGKENTEEYIRKRQAQIIEKRKAGGML